MRINKSKLIAIMADKEISVAELAERSGVARCSISALRGGKSCRESTIIQIAEALNVKPEDLKGELIYGTNR